MNYTNKQERSVQAELVKPLNLVINEAVEKGFDLIFRIKEDGSLWDQNGINYDLTDMKIVYSRVFTDDAEDARQSGVTKVYLLRNAEGDKGILVDGDGIYGDERIAAFIRDMEGIQQSRIKVVRKPGLNTKLIIAAAGLLLIGSAVTFKMLSRRS